MITLNKNEFLEAIKAVKTCCGKQSLTPILSNLHLKTMGQGLEIIGTDIEKSAKAIIEANVEESFDLCVNADKLENIVYSLDDIITFEIKEKTLLIKSGKTKFKLLFLDASDFPEANFTLTDDKIILSKEDFVNGINKTIFATSQIQKNILNGICLTFDNDRYEMAATDGNRLSQVCFDVKTNKQGQYVVPCSVLLNVAKNTKDNVEIYFNNNRILFKTNNFLYQTNLLEGKFPPYQQLIPKNQPLVATVNRALLLKSLEKIAIMCDEKTNMAVFNFKNNELYLTSACSLGKVEDVIDIDFYDDLKIAFNFKYIIEGLRAMQAEKIELKMKNSTGACLITGDYSYIIMPVQIRK